MIKPLLTAIFTLAASVAAAQNQTQITLCTQVGTLAEVLMENRQNGVPMAQQMALAPADGSTASRMLHALVRDAYAVPRFSTPQNRRRAAEDFRDRATAICFSIPMGETS